MAPIIGTDAQVRELIDRAASGDHESFRQLVVRYQERVYAFALRLTGQEADAMDLTQEVFVAAWEGLRRFRGDSTFSTWLLGIATFKARERWRQEERRERREERYRQGIGPGVLTALPGARIDLERALLALPGRMRAALVLHCIEGLPYKEVARIMEIAEGTAKAHVHRARQLLKETLE